MDARPKPSVIQRFLKRMLLYILLVVCAQCIGCALLTGVYAIPTSSMTEALSSSSALLSEEGQYPRLDGTKRTQLDNFTDALMIGQTTMPTDGAAPLENAMKVSFPRYKEDSAKPVKALEVLARDPIGYSGPSGTYERYWCGFLVLMKPLFAAGIDLETIRLIRLLLQSALLVVVLALFAARKQAVYIPAFLAMVVCFRFYLIWNSLQYSSMYEIALVASIVALAIPDRRFADAHFFTGVLPYAFCIIGVVANYVDFLTTPLLSLCIPLLVCIARYSNSMQYTLRNVLIFTARSIFAWFFGYAFMWFGKWLIASIALNQNVFESAIDGILNRSSNTVRGNEISYFKLAAKQLYYLLDPIIIASFLAAFAFSIALALRNAKRMGQKLFSKARLKNLAPYFLVFLLPLAWYLVLSNHSYIHAFMAYRNLAIMEGALLFALAQCSRPLPIPREQPPACP